MVNSRGLNCVATIGVSMLLSAGSAHPYAAEGSASPFVVTCETVTSFAEPEDWRCLRGETACTMCHNVSGHQSEIRFRCVGGEELQTFWIPAGAQLSICPGADVHDI